MTSQDCVTVDVTFQGKEVTSEVTLEDLRFIDLRGLEAMIDVTSED